VNISPELHPQFAHVACDLYLYLYRNSFSLQGVLETKLRILPVEPDPGNAGEGKEKKMATVKRGHLFFAYNYKLPFFNSLIA
jgi:hypothetical protein